MIRKQILLSLCLLLSISAFSQEMDPLYMTTTHKKDTTYRVVEYQVTGPKKSTFLAGILSLVVPGAGQLYNGQWGTAAFYMASNMACNTIMRIAKNNGNESQYSTAFLVGLGINVFAVVNACNGAAKVNFDRGYRSGINVRVAPYVGRNPDLMASSNSGGNNYGLSVNLEF